MDYAEGGTLDDMINNHKDKGIIIPESVVIGVAN